MNYGPNDLFYAPQFGKLKLKSIKFVYLSNNLKRSVASSGYISK